MGEVVLTCFNFQSHKLDFVLTSKVTNSILKKIRLTKSLFHKFNYGRGRPHLFLDVCNADIVTCL
jgi:hypothetical protein